MERITPPDYEVMFSVEVTTYNQEDTIGKVLDSILSQEHNYSYEIIIADDCSTDNTKRIIENYVRKYPDIIKPIYNEHNLGAMKNYYNNVSRAKGKYLMGAGGDDFWLPGKVKTQIEFMERNIDFGVCYGKSKICDENGVIQKGVAGNSYIDYRDILYKENCIFALTACSRKSLFDNYINNIHPERRDWEMEDYPFWIYCAFSSKIYFFLNEFGIYSVISESQSHSTNYMKIINFEFSTFKIREFFSNYFIIDDKKWNTKEQLKKTYNSLLNNKFIKNDKKVYKELKLKYKNEVGEKYKKMEIKGKKILINIISGILPGYFLQILKFIKVRINNYIH